MSRRQPRLARPVAGADCTTIAATTFYPERYKAMDVYGWVVHIGPGCTREKKVDWFRYARSQGDCLRLAYGEGWRIDFLDTMGHTEHALTEGTQPDPTCSTPGSEKQAFYLLTHQLTGWRLLVRIPNRCDAQDEWASMPTTAHGRIGADVATEDARALMEARRTWLADTLQHNTVGAGSMYALLDEVASLARKPTFAEHFANPRPRGIGLSPAAPHWAWDEAVARDLRHTLMEVWLAEQGYTGTDAAAVRTLFALGGEQTLRAYDRSAA